LGIDADSFAAMFRYRFLSILLGCLSGFAALSVRAQDASATDVPVDSLALRQQAVAQADSAGDVVRAVAARLDLVPLLSSGKAMRTLLEAEMLADSGAVGTELELRVHEGLVTLYTGMGEMTKANREWADVARLTKISMEKRSAAALEQVRAEAAVRSTAINDSLMSVLASEHNAMLERERSVKAQQEFWMYGGIGAGAIALLALIALAVLLFGPQRRMRKEFKELKEEVAWLRMVNRKRIEEEQALKAVPKAVAPPVTASTSAAPAITPVPAPAPVTARPEDADLLQLVKARGVERLRTLRDARSRGDREKIVRVVHSMKPQLVALDAARYTELCSRLVTASTDDSAWTADLDRFERAVAGLVEDRA
jgi:hypothetical protein